MSTFEKYTKEDVARGRAIELSKQHTTKPFSVILNQGIYFVEDGKRSARSHESLIGVFENGKQVIA